MIDKDKSNTEELPSLIDLSTYETHTIHNTFNMMNVHLQPCAKYIRNLLGLTENLDLK